MAERILNRIDARFANQNRERGHGSRETMMQPGKQPSQTEFEVLTNEIAAMGPELGKLYHAISRDVTWLHWRWNEYRALFGEKPSRIDLMNESAPFIFQVLHDALFEQTLLGIARLVGPAKSAGNHVLSIERFIALIADDSLRTEITALVEDARTTADFAMQWRHRQIAHRDLVLALQDVAPDATSISPLPIATREKVEAALSALGAVIGKIELAYCKSSTHYASSPWGAKTLLTLIRGGLLREEEKHDCRNRLERHADDINPLPAI
jgi:hypothetical protein